MGQVHLDSYACTLYTSPGWRIESTFEPRATIKKDYITVFISSSLWCFVLIMHRSYINENFCDNASSVVANILLQATWPTSRAGSIYLYRDGSLSLLWEKT